MSKENMKGLSDLLRKDVKGVSIHRKLRKKLYDHPRHKERNRLAVMLTEDASCHFKDGEIQRENDKMSFEWQGSLPFKLLNDQLACTGSFRQDFMLASM